MKKITLFFVALFITSVSFGQMSGTYQVGTGQTYETLKALFDDINSNGVSGNITIEITSDLTEAANIGLGVNTNGYSITIRPDQDVDRTITFTQTTDNTSPTGHIVIGYLGTGLTSAWSDANTITTSNVTIDGYADGGSTRRLTITNQNASVTGARMIVIVGGCDNTVIKNCIITNQTTSTSSPFCVGAVIRKGDAIEVAPSNLTIDNNIMTSLGNNVAMGMRITYSGTLTGNVKVSGLVIKDNTITARRRLIEINYTSGADIYNNEFITQQTGAPGTVSYGLWTSSGVSGTINIYNNKFSQAYTEETGAYGHRVISLSSGATYNIYNNMFSGLDKTKASTVALNLCYLFYSGVSGKIYNNTFYMPTLTDASSTGYYNAIQISGNTAEIKNNIFISDETTHSNTAFISTVPTSSDYNDFYLRSSHTGSKIVSTYTTLFDYQTANATNDANSVSKDVNFVSATDLSLTGSSINDPDLAAPAIGSPVTTDIFGNSRYSPKVYMGAHEPSDINSVLTNINNEAEPNTRIMRTYSGIAAIFDGSASVELYSINGTLIDRVKANGSYSRDLEHGIYIIRINGKAIKFVR